MFYNLRQDVKIHKSLDKYYLSFINRNLNTGENAKGIIEINISGYEILSLCNGKQTEQGIITELLKKYPNEELEEMVRVFLAPFITDGLIIIMNNPSDIELVKILGSSEYYCPSTIMLELTNYCPLDCVHCYLGKKENEYIRKEDLQPILENIVDLGVHYVQLTGGEVMTYPHLEYAIDYLITHHIQVNVSTSGIMCRDEDLSILSKIKATGGFIRVSLDGLEETHNQIRRNSKSFNNAVSFLKKAVSLGIETQVATCIINQQCSEIHDLTKLVKSLGVKQQIFERVYLQGNAESNALDSRQSLTEFTTLLSELAETFADDRFSIATENTINGENCGAGYKTYKISYDLEITPCIVMNYSLGNLKKEDFRKIIKNNYEKFRSLRIPCRAICGSCEMLDNCDGCVAKVIQYKNQVKACHWYKKQNAFKSGGNHYDKN